MPAGGGEHLGLGADAAGAARAIGKQPAEGPGDGVIAMIQRGASVCVRDGAAGSQHQMPTTGVLPEKRVTVVAAAQRGGGPGTSAAAFIPGGAPTGA